MDFFFSSFLPFFSPFLFEIPLLSIPSKEKVELEMVLKELKDQEMLQLSIEMLTHRIFPSPVHARLSHPIIREKACSSGGCVDSVSSVTLSMFFFFFFLLLLLLLFFFACILKLFYFGNGCVIC